jgi:hypothetical protein
MNWSPEIFSSQSNRQISIRKAAPKWQVFFSTLNNFSIEMAGLDIN